MLSSQESADSCRKFPSSNVWGACVARTCYREILRWYWSISNRSVHWMRCDGDLPVSLQEILALMRRHFIAVTIVVIAAVGVAVIFKRAPVSYQETGTVAFTAPPSSAYPNPYTSFSDESLIETAGLMSRLVMGFREQQEIRAAGGVGTYDIALVNKYNLEYPNFSDPYVTVTATFSDYSQAHLTFETVIHKLYGDLYSLQTLAKVPPENRVEARMIGDSGPLAQPGSWVRVYTGLLVLAIVAAFSVAVFLDRHPLRLSTVFRNIRSQTLGTSAAD
jgi:hypothetical protein